MGRYEVHVGIEGEYEPGSRERVLRNLKGITSKRVMDQAEADALLAVQQRYLAIITSKTVFTTRLILKMHRDWLGELYAWAGRFRTVEVSKGGFTWPPAGLVAQNMENFERQFLKACTPCIAQSIDSAALVMAKVQAEFLMVHPFREGNGRISRWITDLMALQAGFPQIDYGFTGKGGRHNSRAYLSGVVSGYGGDYEPLARFLAEGLRRGILRAGGRVTPRAPSK